jgi:hypothetical protein
MHGQMLYYTHPMETANNSFDFWYAVNNTEIVHLPEGNLETFGTTIINYHLVTELMDSVNQIRIREGRLEAGQPQIITPDAYLQTMLDGFGDEAQKYIDWLKKYEKDIHVLQYAFQLKQESFTEHIVTDSLENVVNRVRDAVSVSKDPLGAVLVGVDSPWDVCLIRLFREVIQKSAPLNIREMQNRSLFDQDNGVPRGVRNSIEDAFAAANRNPDQINSLNAKLQTLGLFDQYEDRFFSLVKSLKNTNKKEIQ